MEDTGKNKRGSFGAQITRRVGKKLQRRIYIHIDIVIKGGIKVLRRTEKIHIHEVYDVKYVCSE